MLRQGYFTIVCASLMGACGDSYHQKEVGHRDDEVGHDRTGRGSRANYKHEAI